MDTPLTDREWATLRELRVGVAIDSERQYVNAQWARPMDLCPDGVLRSAVPGVLTRLVGRGLVDRRTRHGHYTRASYLYRISAAGYAYYRARMDALYEAARPYD